MPHPIINVYRSENTARLLPNFSYSGSVVDVTPISDDSLYKRLAASHPGKKSGVQNLANDPVEDCFKMPAYTRVEEVALERAPGSSLPIQLVTSCGPNFPRMFNYGFVPPGQGIPKEQLIEIMKSIYMDALLAAAKNGSTDIILTQLSTGYFAGAEGNKSYMRGVCAESMACAIEDYQGAVKQGRATPLNIHIAAGEAARGVDFSQDMLVCRPYEIPGVTVHSAFSDEVALSLAAPSKKIALQIAGADNSGKGGLAATMKEKQSNRKHRPNTSEEAVRCRLVDAYQAATEAVPPGNILFCGDLQQEASPRALAVNSTVVGTIGTQVSGANTHHGLRALPKASPPAPSYPNSSVAQAYRVILNPYTKMTQTELGPLLGSFKKAHPLLKCEIIPGKKYWNVQGLTFEGAEDDVKIVCIKRDVTDAWNAWFDPKKLQQRTGGQKARPPVNAPFQPVFIKFPEWVAQDAAGNLLKQFKNSHIGAALPRVSKSLNGGVGTYQAVEGLNLTQERGVSGVLCENADVAAAWNAWIAEQEQQRLFEKLRVAVKSLRDILPPEEKAFKKVVSTSGELLNILAQSVDVGSIEANLKLLLEQMRTTDLYKSWNECKGVSEMASYMMYKLESAVRWLLECVRILSKSTPEEDIKRDNYFFKGPKKEEVFDKFNEALSDLAEIKIVPSNAPGVG